MVRVEQLSSVNEEQHAGRRKGINGGRKGWGERSTSPDRAVSLRTPWVIEGSRKLNGRGTGSGELRVR